MQTKFVVLDISLLKEDAAVTLRSDELRSRIETHLVQHGAPLRWAITAVNKSAQTAHIEAIVTTV